MFVLPWVGTPSVSRMIVRSAVLVRASDPVNSVWAVARPASMFVSPSSGFAARRRSWR